MFLQYGISSRAWWMCEHPGVASTDQPSGAQAVDRALRVLRAFENADDDLGISDVAAATGLTPSTTHRLIRALCRGGLLVQDPRTERYQLGPLLVVLGRRAEQRLGYAALLPMLDELAAESGESASLGIRTGDEVLVVLHHHSEQPLRFDAEPGTRVPLHTSAMGKAILAFSGDPEQAVASLPELEARTRRTITDRRRLLEQLVAIHRRGWAFNDEERDPGVRAVAAPIRDPSGVAQAAVAIQGPTVRMVDSRIDDLGTRLVEATAEMAGALGLA
jgi:IclR family transcriptional regulator, acetate operon repressor